METGSAVEPSEVDAALESVRSLMLADGANFALLAIAPDGVVELELLLEDASCAPCVMPRPHLEQVALTMMSRRLPELRRVSVVDPRDAMGTEEHQ
jgi:Fe-S cluster biogenesis protein NfuA